MNPEYTILIDTDYLAGVDRADRTWLEKWLHATSPRRPYPNICTVSCRSHAEAGRVLSMLTSRGLPQGSSIVRGAA